MKTKQVATKTDSDFEFFKDKQFNFDALSTPEDEKRLNLALESIPHKPQVEVAVGIRIKDKIRYMNIHFKNIYDKHKQLVNTIGYIEDITNLKYEERLKEDLRYKAEIDGLTGLYNARAAFEKISYQMTQSKCSYQVLCLMDLDNFKGINDTLGHSVGNKVLSDLAKVLKASFRSSDLIARIGGDEFLIYFETNDLSFIDKKFQSLVLKCTKTYEENKQKATVSASFGLSYKPKDGDTLDILFKKADTALYQVKRESKCGYRLYSQELEENNE